MISLKSAALQSAWWVILVPLLFSTLLVQIINWLTKAAMMSLLGLIITAFKIKNLGSIKTKLMEHEQIPADLILLGQKGETETLIWFLQDFWARATSLKSHTLRRCYKFVTSGYLILRMILHSPYSDNSSWF